MRLQRKIPLHLPREVTKDDAMERLLLHADMASLNPEGFRTASEKKNRKRTKTRVEKFGKMVA